MPYEISKDPSSKSGRVIVKRKDTGKVVARPKSQERAQAMIRAIYANENKGK